jgi:hypothetical protein
MCLVDSNEKLGGWARRKELGFNLGLWRSRVILNLIYRFPVKSLFPFPLVTAKLIGNVLSFFDHLLLRSSLPGIYYLKSELDALLYWRSYS